MLESVAKHRARRHGSAWMTERHRIVARVTSALMRRAARMVLQFLPRAEEQDEDVGADEMVPCSEAAMHAGDPASAALPPFAADAFGSGAVAP